jgi:hypothetical protein
LIIQSSRPRRGNALVATGELRHSIIRAVANVVCHVEIWRVAVRHQGQNGIGELVIRAVPRAMIRSDRTVDRIGREAWNSLAPVRQLRDLSSGDRDVRARHEHR